VKKIKKKRIILYCPWTDEEIIGAEEYEGYLSDENIIGIYYEVGKAQWYPTHPDYDELWYLKEQNGIKIPYYKVGVSDFYIEVPSFWDKVKNALR